MNNLGELLKKRRASMGMSLRDFAKICGISHAYIKNIEDGDPRTGKKIMPSLNSIEKLAPALGMTVGELLAEIGYKNHVQYGLQSFDRNSETGVLEHSKSNKNSYLFKDPNEANNIEINSELKEFIINPENKGYLMLAKELSDSGVSVESARKLLFKDELESMSE